MNNIIPLHLYQTTIEESILEGFDNCLELIDSRLEDYYQTQCSDVPVAVKRFCLTRNYKVIEDFLQEAISQATTTYVKTIETDINQMLKSRCDFNYEIEFAITSPMHYISPRLKEYCYETLQTLWVSRIISGINQIAWTAITEQMLPREHLQKLICNEVNGLFQVFQNGMQRSVEMDIVSDLVNLLTGVLENVKHYMRRELKQQLTDACIIRFDKYFLAPDPELLVSNH
jgi:hypothetical protein